MSSSTQAVENILNRRAKTDPSGKGIGRGPTADYITPKENPKIGSLKAAVQRNLSQNFVNRNAESYAGYIPEANIGKGPRRQIKMKPLTLYRKNRAGSRMNLKMSTMVNRGELQGYCQRSKFSPATRSLTMNPKNIESDMGAMMNKPPIKKKKSTKPKLSDSFL